MRNDLARDVDAAARDRLQTEDGAADLRLAGADQSRQSNDLTGAHVDGDVTDAAVDQRQGNGLQHDRTGLLIDRRVEGVDGATGHQLDEAGLRDVASRNRGHRVAVAQDSHPIGDAANLLDAVRDVDDAEPLLLQTLDQCEEAIGLVLRQ